MPQVHISPSFSLVFHEGSAPLAQHSQNLVFELADAPQILTQFPARYQLRSPQVTALASSLAIYLRRLPLGARRLLAGGVAGAVGKTATAPLEAIKLQVVQGHLGTLDAASLIYTRSGLGGFFRGNGLDVLRTVPSKAIELAAFDALKKKFLYSAHKYEVKLPDGLVIAASGAIAGVLASVAVHPLETVRTRLAVAGSQGGALACAAKIMREEGAGALFRGLDASMVGVIPYAAIRLATYDGLKRGYKQATGEEHVSPQAALMFGATAGVISAVATFPLEVARRRMMMGASYSSLGAALVGIVGREGPAALFAGVWLTVLKQAPQYALGFASYEQAKRALAV